MTYDVVVVGGGHNGLVAACFLSRAGLRVVVAEKEPRLGGMTLSAPLVPDAPEHVLSPGAYENVYLRAGGVVEELGLAHHGYREVDGAGWAWLGAGGESLLFTRSVEETVREVARFSRDDARRYRELADVALRVLALQDRYSTGHPSRPGWRTLLALARPLVADRRLRATLGGLLTATAADAIPTTFQSAPMRGAQASIGSILGAPTAEGSGLALLATMLLHHKGAARPIGGMGGLVAALARCLHAHGGEALTNAEVVRIAPGADAVELADGRTLRARAVLAACPPQLVPALAGDALDGAVGARIAAAPGNASGVATITVSLALRGRLELPPRDDGVDLRRPVLFAGTFEDVLAACAEVARGELTQLPTWCLTIFSAIDPSQAPPGQDALQLYGPTPVMPAGGWDARRDEAADALVATLAGVVPRLAELEIGRYVETPADLARRTGATNGCIYHVDHLPTRLGPLRPALGAGGYRTPLRGLYLGSAGCHPGGGVSGLPGKLAAQTILRDR